MKNYTLQLDTYERDNLRWLLAIASLVYGLDTGDWVMQIHHKLHDAERGEGRWNTMSTPAQVAAELNGVQLKDKPVKEVAEHTQQLSEAHDEITDLKSELAELRGHTERDAKLAAAADGVLRLATMCAKAAAAERDRAVAERDEARKSDETLTDAERELLRNAAAYLRNDWANVPAGTGWGEKAIVVLERLTAVRT